MSGDEEFSLQLSKSTACSNAAKRLLFSKAHYALYLLMIIANLILVVWIIVNAVIVKRFTSPSHWMFLVLEIFINIALAAEVSLMMLTLGKKYWHSRANIVDFVILMLSILSLVLYFATQGSGDDNVVFQKAEGLTTTLLLVFRYGIQFIRLVFLVNHQRNVLKNNSSVVDFSTIDENPVVPLEDQDEFHMTTRTST